MATCSCRWLSAGQLQLQLPLTAPINGNPD
jgi:hypothetical protein